MPPPPPPASCRSHWGSRRPSPPATAPADPGARHGASGPASRRRRGPRLRRTLVAPPAGGGAMSLTRPDKITPRHRERRAYVYVRQSTLQQVEHHRESRANQYALVQRAPALGWPRERVHVVDADLGQSGQDGERPGLPGAGGGGVARAGGARPGLRGQPAGAQQRRLVPPARPGGRWSGPSWPTPTASTTRATTTTACCWACAACSARRSCTCCACGWTPGGGARSSAATTASTCRPGWSGSRTGGWSRTPTGRSSAPSPWSSSASPGWAPASKVVRSLRDDGLLLPRRQIGGPPARASCCGSGRRAGRCTSSCATRPTPGPSSTAGGGPARHGRLGPRGRAAQRLRTAPEAWAVLHQGVYPAYITWEQYVANPAAPDRQRQPFAAAWARGAPRAGAALLAGLVVCGRCGHQVRVAYKPQPPLRLQRPGRGVRRPHVPEPGRPQPRAPPWWPPSSRRWPRRSWTCWTRCWPPSAPSGERLASQYADQVARAEYEARLAQRQLPGRRPRQPPGGGRAGAALGAGAPARAAEAREAAERFARAAPAAAARPGPAGAAPRPRAAACRRCGRAAA